MTPLVTLLAAALAVSVTTAVPAQLEESTWPAPDRSPEVMADGSFKEHSLARDGRRFPYQGGEVLDTQHREALDRLALAVLQDSSDGSEAVPLSHHLLQKRSPSRHGRHGHKHRGHKHHGHKHRGHKHHGHHGPKHYSPKHHGPKHHDPRYYSRDTRYYGPGYYGPEYYDPTHLEQRHRRVRRTTHLWEKIHKVGKGIKHLLHSHHNHQHQSGAGERPPTIADTERPTARGWGQPPIQTQDDRPVARDWRAAGWDPARDWSGGRPPLVNDTDRPSARGWNGAQPPSINHDRPASRDWGQPPIQTPDGRPAGRDWNGAGWDPASGWRAAGWDPTRDWSGARPAVVNGTDRPSARGWNGAQPPSINHDDRPTARDWRGAGWGPARDWSGARPPLVSDTGRPTPGDWRGAGSRWPPLVSDTGRPTPGDWNGAGSRWPPTVGNSDRPGPGDWSGLGWDPPTVADADRPGPRRWPPTVRHSSLWPHQYGPRDGFYPGWTTPTAPTTSADPATTTSPTTSTTSSPTTTSTTASPTTATPRRGGGVLVHTIAPRTIANQPSCRPGFTYHPPSGVCHERCPTGASYHLSTCYCDRDGYAVDFVFWRCAPAGGGGATE